MNGCKSIMIVLDCFSKYVVFVVAMGACPTEVAAKLFHNHVIKYFSLLKDIVSDRDPRFTRRFWTILFNLMGSELKFSTINHPQIDGYMERINSLLEVYLHHYVDRQEMMEEAKDSLKKAARCIKYVDLEEAS